MVQFGAMYVIVLHSRTVDSIPTIIFIPLVWRELASMISEVSVDKHEPDIFEAG